jgi:hypothetical protein
MGTAVLVGATAVLTLGSSLLARVAFPQFHGLLVLAFIGLFIPPCAPMLCQETRGLLVKHGPQETLLSATTPTGPRTIDLGAITRVRGFFLPGRFGKSVNLLIVTDAHGVRIGLRSFEARAALSEALDRVSARDTAAPVKSSRNAQRRISNEFSVTWDFLVPLLLTLVWIVSGLVGCAVVTGA